MRKLIIGITLLIPIIYCNAQNGPGGVGKKDGTSSLKLWLDADYATYNGSYQVTAWNNLVSIPELNMVNTTFSPNFVSSKFNGHATVSFENQADAMQSSSTLSNTYFPETAASSFVVTLHDNMSQQSSTYATQPYEDANRFSTHMPWANTIYYDIGECCTANGRINYNYNSAWLTELSLFSYRAGSSYQKEAWRNNVSQVTGSTGTATFTNQSNYRFQIGHSSSSNFQGDISEVLIYNVGLNNAQMTIVSNYLAAKYAMSISNDLYVFESKHGHELIGVGQSGTDTHTNAKSANILSIKNPNALGDGDYIFSGHDNKSIASWTTSEQMNGDTNVQRLAREWRVDVTGTPGTVTLSLDPTLLPAKTSTYDFYTLWTDADGDFSSGATAHALTVNGGEFEVSGVTLSDGMFIAISIVRPVIQFASTASNGAENTVSNPLFTVSLNYAVSGNISVNYTFANGTATSAGDYTYTNGTSTIIAGSTSTQITTANIVPDAVVENDLYFTITLSAPTFGILGTNTVHTYTINDDDNTQLVQFEAPFNYGYKKRITVDNTKVFGSSNLTDFPVMISFTDPDLRTTGNGGHVQHASGYDIRFTLGNSVTWLDHEIEYYNATTGEYVAWVRIPSLSYNADTKIDMYYGNSTVSTDPSKTTTWVNYHAVYHLGSDDVTDSRGVYNGTNSGTTDALGKTGRSQYFDGSDIIELVGFPDVNTQFTVSMWFNTTDDTHNGRLFSDDVNNTGWAISFADAAAQKVRTFNRGYTINNGIVDATYTFNQDTWYNVVLIVDRTNEDRIIYVNGASNISDLSDVGTWTTDAGNAAIGGEAAGGENIKFLGYIDEVKIASVIRSADWIATEYNNQNNPSSFYSVGTETALTGFNISESTSTITLTVGINAISGIDTQINYAATGGTATGGGTDYTLTAGTATITAGQLTTTFSMTIVNDLIDEADETIIISLSSPTNANLGTNSTITLTILDDDASPTVQFTNATSKVNEGTGQFSLPVQISAVSGQNITVDYAVTGGDATSNADYILTAGTLSITAGSLTKNIIVNIIDDSSIENPETIQITLSNPVGATLGTNTVNTVTINDNDNLGFDGPGGIGKSDGSGTLTMWYMADSATYNGSNQVTGLQNLVGISAYDMENTSNMPDFITNAVNGHSEISFNNVNDALVTNSVLSASTFPYNEATTFIVARHDNNSQQSITYGTATTKGGLLATNRFSATLPWSGVVYYDIGDSGGSDFRINFNYDGSWVGNYSIFSYVASGADGRSAYRNNTLQAGPTAQASPFLDHSSNYFHLGQSYSTPFQGDIAEFILFTRPVNTTQRNIMNNYLAAKYGLTIANDYYVWQASHPYEVAGIGQVSSSDKHVAAKAGALTIESPGDLNDGEYMLFGHNNGLTSSWTATNIPTGDFQRLAREWRFGLTGAPGSISISIDPDELPALPVGYEEYVIIVDDNGTFSSGATVYETTLIDGEYVTSSIDIKNGDYVAIATLKRKVQFNTTAINKIESSQGLLTVSVDYTSANNITVDYTIAGGTATAGADFSVATTGTITLLAGQTQATLDLGIIDESELEGDETIITTLSNPSSNAQLGTNTVFTYTITDDDNTREFFFADPCEFGFMKTLTIDNTQVSGSADLTNFPLLVNIAGDADLAANVQNANGYDIYFKLQGTQTWLKHEIESFDGGAGDFVAWVLIPALDYDQDMVIEMYYGNADISLDPSTTDVWDDYLGVWHLGDDFDASANNYDGTSNGTDVVTARFGNGRDFDGVGDFIELASFPDLQQDFTISAWVNLADLSSGQRVFIDDDNNTGGYALSVGDNGTNNVRFFSRSFDGYGIVDDNSAGLSTSTWMFLVGTADISLGSDLYVNGTLGASVARTGGPWGTDVGSAAIGGETLSGETDNRFTGIMDEVRVYNGLLSADRVATEFNNQQEGSTFYTLSAETVSAGCVVTEADGTISVMVAITPSDNTSATTATFTATGGSATAGEDYVLAQATVTIPIGARSASFTFEITNDLLDEIDETLTITLSNPTTNAKIGANSTITYTITDDDTGPEIDFVDSESTVNEGTATVTVGLKLSAESGNDVTVNYSVLSSTATDGADYIFPAGTATITAGNLNTNITLSIIDDAEIEIPENIVIEISSPTNGTLGTITQHTMTINDNDDLGYNGPGGVGEITGAKTLKLWLAADSAVVSGSNVTAWNNSVTNVTGLDFTPVGTSPNRIDDAVNGHSEISFNNVNDVLVSNNALSATTFPYNEGTFFVVTRTDNLGQVSNAYTTSTSSSGVLAANQISANIPSSSNTEFEINGVGISVPYQTAWANGDHSIFTHRITSDSSIVWRNNNIEGQTSTDSNPFTNHPSYKFYIGRQETDPFQGDIAELIMFTRPVNNSQIAIVNNYLSSKYSIPVTDDYYLFDNTHGNEVAGIGRTALTDQHVAARAGVITVSNANDLGDGEFVMFGHDNGSISSWVSTNVPAGDSIRRVSREWRFNNTGTPGSITIAIDQSLLPTPYAGYQDYVIFVDKDGDFTEGAEVYQTTFVDGQYKAADIPIVSADYVTVGIIIRTIQFDLAISNASENSSLNVGMNMNYPYNVDISFNYQITGGTATGGNVDYSTPSTGTITILAGQTTALLPMGVNNDATLESDETIILTISSPPAGFRIGAINTHTYTINDDDNTRKIQFNAASSSGAENVMNISLQVDLNSADPTNPTTVNYAITGGTAEASPAPDYAFTAGTLTIPATQTTGNINFTVFDDVLYEATETIIISLSNPTNANLGTNKTHTYSITDNDAAVTVAFQSTTTTIDEGGSVAHIVVALSNPSGQATKVDYAVTGGTATGGGVDYALANGTLTIAAGQQIKNINIALTDDTVEEVAETIIIDLSNPIGATLGANVQHTVTIVDNDATFGYYGPGGVGGKTRNKLWLDAASINGKGVTNPTNGASIATWKDHSGNSNNFAAIGTQPVYNSTGLNSKETINISSSAHGFRAPSGFTNSLGNYTIIGVVQQTSGQYLAETNTVANGDFRVNQGTNGLYHLNGNNRLAANSSTNIDLMTWTFNSALSPNNALVYRNGTSLASDNNYSVMALGNNFSIGSRASGESVTDFGGKISEFIVYNKPINTAQRIIAENYLSSKYGITIANDYYSYDGTYGYDVVGIGQVDASNFHLQSMSDSLLMISGASSLGDGDFIFAGHDNRGKSSWTTTEAPNNGSNIRRLAREWRVDLTGTPGTMILKIDKNKLPTPPTGYDQYLVWTDEDGDFRSGATAYQVEYSPIFGFHVSAPVTVNDGTFITIGVGQPVVQFTTATSSGMESVTNPQIQVSLNFTLGATVTVNYAATGGTATGGNVDYLLTSGTLNISPGQTTANIIPGIINDLIQENDETIIITLTTPSSNVSLGSISEHTYTIHDNDNVRNIQYQAPLTANATESSATYTVTVEIDVTDATNSTTVDILPVSTGSYATLGSDYTLSTNTVTIAANTSTATFDINIVNDAFFESNETITLNLTNPANSQLGANTQFVYTINDDDTAPSVQFSSADSYIGEAAGIASLNVKLSSVSVQNITVDYTVSASTATQGVDFTLADGTLTILAGHISENILMNIVDDIVTEGSETVTVTISNPVNATLAAQTTHVVNIVDNDAAGSVGPGGVGDATSNLVWLSGDQYNGTTWTDKSGNNFDLNGGTSPSLVASDANFNSQPTLGFNGTTNYLDASNITSVASDYDVFFVMRSDGTTTDQVLYHSDNIDDLMFGYQYATGSYLDKGASWVGNELTFAGTSILHYNLESGTANVLIDGVSNHTAAYSATAQTGTKRLGSTTGGANYFAGNIGEVIMYNSLLNDAQKIIVNNYLSSKYDINIGALDRYSYDGIGEFTENLIGIGREDAQNLHIAATQENFLTISNPNNLGDGEYLMAAHEDITIATWVTAETPDPLYYNRLQREWRVKMTGNVGTVTVEIDTTYLPTPVETGLTWVLLVDGDGNFTTTDNIYVLSPTSGDKVGVNGIQFNDGNFFTIAQMKFATTGSGDFNSPATWSTGVVPYAGVDVSITNGHNIFLSANSAVGSMTIGNGATLDLSGFTLEFSDGCITTVGTGSVDVSTTGSTVAYVNPNVVNQCVTSMTYNNLYTSGTTGSSKYLTGDIIVNGDLELTSASGGATFDARDFGTSNDYDITLRGNWTSEVTFLPRTGTVTLDGTLDQIINTQGGETFNNLIINKASGEVQLSSEININSLITLTNGKLSLGTQNLNIQSTGAIAGGSATSYIVADNVGVLRHAVTTLGATLTFPIGDVDEYAPFIFKLNTGTLGSSFVTINMRDTKHTGIVEPHYITRYWTLNRENITNPVNYDVTYYYQNVDVVGNEGLILARKFSVEGNGIGGTYNRSTNELSYAGYTSFSDHTGESLDYGLPVELLTFSGEVVDQGILLRWETASEKDNEYFEIEKSRDGLNFEVVGKRVRGNGTIYTLSNYLLLDETPYFGISYYRLVQVDYDGSFTLYDPIKINNENLFKGMEVGLFPNPTDQSNVNLRIQSGDENSMIEVMIFDMQGRRIYQDKLKPVLGTEDYNIQLKGNIPWGLYHVIIRQGVNQKTLKLILN